MYMVVKTKTSPTLHVYNRNIYYPVWQSESITEKVEINEGFLSSSLHHITSYPTIPHLPYKYKFLKKLFTA